ncbi:MAG: hypothetical protein ACI9FE_000724, partial [Porticoccaceae bacterium]
THPPVPCTLVIKNVNRNNLTLFTGSAECWIVSQSKVLAKPNNNWML